MIRPVISDAAALARYHRAVRDASMRQARREVYENQASASWFVVDARRQNKRLVASLRLMRASAPSSDFSWMDVYMGDGK